GLEIPDSATPFEVARSLKSTVPELAEPIDRLVRRHVEATYGPGPGPGSAEESEATWLDLRAPLARAMLRRRLSRPRRAAPGQPAPVSRRSTRPPLVTGETEQAP